MENNSLFPFKYRIRKTDEPVEVIAWETAEKGSRSENDWVSYIDSHGEEHVKEHLTLEWDLVIDSPFDSWMTKWEPMKLPEFDPWEQRRYELAKEFLTDGLADIDGAVLMADELIADLKKEPKSDDEKENDYENIGVGEIVDAIDGTVHVRKFAFTDRKDIVGFRGDDGRWAVGDKVKVYIKKFTPKKGL